ncbi:hypothetical protein DNL40_06445 [Xylanimonas oleitrophica]|uniref:Uncharacterized protein n=1 Tax=Xylanimonas oleitrophica TaxID=2607479 RepID=A0A2W5WQ99_9MICO|nr:hypothetical protein [Xylanimonas oleitrophica]PZR53759.1 hypothetical protein DNL40_06445 [Xylanimonas oleitrophica]
MRTVATRAHGPRALATFAAGFCAAFLGLTAIATAPPARAYWSDSQTVSAGTITAGTVPAPELDCQGISIGRTTFTWTAVPDVTAYEFHHGPDGASADLLPASTTSATRSGLVETGDAWVNARRDFGQVTWASAPSGTASYAVYLLALGLCQAPGDYVPGPWPYPGSP